MHNAGTGGDWHLEAKQMASIYKNAVLAIAVVDHTSLSEASEKSTFLSKEEELTTSSLVSEDSTPESVHLWLSKSGNFVSRPLGDLDERGWVFQEQLLLGRTISLTKDGVFWDCLHHSASSSRPTGILGDFSPDFQFSDMREFKRFLLSPEPSFSKEQYYWLWRRAVQSYTKRILTKESDRLIALEGITSHMATLLDDNCVLGIWKKDTMRSLMWFVQPWTKGRTIGSGIKGPSWSWISIEGPVQYRLWHPYGQEVDIKHERISTKALVMKLSATPESPRRFDRFTGEIALLAPLAKAYLFRGVVYLVRRWRSEDFFEGKKNMGEWLDAFEIREDTGERRSYYSTKGLLDVPWLAIAITRWNSYSRTADPKENRVSCLLLFEGGYTDILTAHYCLILEKFAHPDGGAFYRRIGICALNTRDICVSSNKICRNQHKSYSDCMGRVEEVRIL